MNIVTDKHILRAKTHQTSGVFLQFIEKIKVKLPTAYNGVLVVKF